MLGGAAVPAWAVDAVIDDSEVVVDAADADPDFPEAEAEADADPDSVVELDSADVVVPDEVEEDEEDVVLVLEVDEVFVTDETMVN
jgi:hypothetical protein